jgi:hypothetical protein
MGRMETLNAEEEKTGRQPGGCGTGKLGEPRPLYKPGRGSRGAKKLPRLRRAEGVFFSVVARFSPR